MLRHLSIKALIAAVFVVILALALAATASVFVTDRMTREALVRHEQAMAHQAGTEPHAADATDTYRELERSIALGTRLTLAVRVASFLVGLALAVVVYRRVARMVASITDYAGRIERGAFASRFACDGDSEEAALAGALNRMVDRLNAAVASEAAARKRMDFTVETSPAVIYVALPDDGYDVTYISPNIRRQLGHAPTDFLGDPAFWANNIHPDDRARVQAEMDTLPTTGRIAVEYRFRHADGGWRWIHDEMALVRAAAGAPPELVGSWFDVTPRKRMEESLLHRDAILNAVAYGAERFLHAAEEPTETQWRLAVEAVLSHLGEAAAVSRIWVAENLRDAAGGVAARVAHCWAAPGFVIPDADPLFAARISYQGEGVAVEALRLRRGELLDLRPADLPPAMRARFERLGIRTLAAAPVTVGTEWWGFVAFDDCATERVWTEAETEALRAAGSLFGTAVAARARQAALRASLETLGSALEKLKRQSAEIERQNAELIQAGRMKAEFLAAVTHELKTPLNAILGFADVLQAGLAGDLAPQQTGYVDDILGAGRQLLGLVSRLIELAQIDAGKLSCAPQATDVGTLLAQAAAARAAAAEARGIAIAVEAEDVAAEVDARLLRRLLDELIDNAVKFNRAGGTVTLRARRAGDGIDIEVADSGAGIAADDLAGLFRPFAQLDAALARSHGGAGIGLALAQRIAALHGGRIEATSTPGAGSTFTVRLPRALPAAVRPLPTPEPP